MSSPVVVDYPSPSASPRNSHRQHGVHKPTKLHKVRRSRSTSEPHKPDVVPSSPSSTKTLPLWRRQSVIELTDEMPSLRRQLSGWSLRGGKSSRESKRSTFGATPPRNERTERAATATPPRNERVVDYAADIPKKLSGWFNSLMTSEASSPSSPTGSTSASANASASTRRSSIVAPKRLDRAIRYIFDTDANVSTSTEPAWLLGQRHDMKIREQQEVKTEPNTPDKRFSIAAFRNNSPAPTWPATFYADFTNLVWCTYRTGFPPIAPSTLTTDCGWGCMLRSGQSMLANTLLIRHLGRNWRRTVASSSDDFATYVKILTWFMDDMSPACPFSVHRMALVGKQMGKEIGEWFGPSTAAEAIRALIGDFIPAKLAIYVANDGAIYRKDVYKAASAKDGSFEPVLILIGTRLGIDNVNPIYYEALRRLLRRKESVGIAGGRPSSSYYFVGIQEDELFYLDPHHARPTTGSIKTPSESDLASFHCDKPRRMPLSHLDPSMLLGFLVQDAGEFEEFCSSVQSETSKESGATPLFYFADEKPSFWDQEGDEIEEGYDNAGVETFSEVEGVDAFASDDLTEGENEEPALSDGFAPASVPKSEEFVFDHSQFSTSIPRSEEFTQVEIPQSPMTDEQVTKVKAETSQSPMTDEQFTKVKAEPSQSPTTDEQFTEVKAEPSQSPTTDEQFTEVKAEIPQSPMTDEQVTKVKAEPSQSPTTDEQFTEVKAEPTQSPRTDEQLTKVKAEIPQQGTPEQFTKVKAINEPFTKVDVVESDSEPFTKVSAGKISDERFTKISADTDERFTKIHLRREADAETSNDDDR